jgi:hypothetical protein
MLAPAGMQQSAQQQARSQNSNIRKLLLSRCIDRMLPIPGLGALSASQAAGTSQIAVAPLAVGLLKKFIIELTGTANNTDGADAALLSDLGLANLISQVQFIDTQSFTRVQTTGWHLDFLFRAKHRTGASRSLLSSAIIDSGNFGNNFAELVAPTNFAHGSSQPFRMVWELPICYSDEDLRGGVFLGTLNSPSQLNITLTQNPFAAAGVDSTLSAWKGAAGNISNLSLNVYQVFLDQIPRDKANNPILPPLDMSTVYELKNTTNQTPYQAGQDNPLSYGNLRRFMSTCLIYNDNPAADAGRVGGTDINYFALQSANVTNFWKKFPLQLARESRVLIGTDLPLGCYYVSHRKKPINTVTYGNMQLILNPIDAAANAYALIGWEDFATVQAIINQAQGSLS